MTIDQTQAAADLASGYLLRGKTYTVIDMESLPTMTVAPNRMYAAAPGTNYVIRVDTPSDVTSPGDRAVFAVTGTEPPLHLHGSKVVWHLTGAGNDACSVWMIEQLDGSGILLEYEGPLESPPIVRILESPETKQVRADIEAAEAAVKAAPLVITIPAGPEPDAIPPTFADDGLLERHLCAAPGPGGRVCALTAAWYPNGQLDHDGDHVDARNYNWTNHHLGRPTQPTPPGGAQETVALDVFIAKNRIQPPEPGPLVPLLSTLELDVVRRLGAIANDIAKVINEGGDVDVVAGDIDEMVGCVHVLQKMVMGQAAARAYPAEFRLLGARFNPVRQRVL